ncbi:MAG: adenosine deaminase, partial [Rickettsiales bacterium]
CVVKDLKDHPLRKMLDLGLQATINSDDPSYFGGYMNENYKAITHALGLSEAELLTLTRNSIEASFLDAAGKQQLHNALETYVKAA